jgi:hypothetical protein
VIVSLKRSNREPDRTPSGLQDREAARSKCAQSTRLDVVAVHGNDDKGYTADGFGMPSAQ